MASLLKNTLPPLIDNLSGKALHSLFRCFGMLAVLSSIFWQGETAAEEKPPNVVIFLTDDQGTLDAGCYGADDLKTPAMDRLAAEGVRFTQAYAHIVCCPTRAALLTGRYPQRGGVNDWTQGNYHSKAGNNMELDEVTLAEALQGASYRTALFGKWHLGAATGSGPLQQGFDEFFGHRGGFIDNFNHHFLHQKGFHDLWDGDEEVFRKDEFFPDLVIKRAGDFIRQNQDKPFFLYLPFNTPHYPEQPPQSFLDLYPDLEEPRRTYAAFVSMTDHYIETILDQLDALKLSENTLVIFMSDNGHSVEQNEISVDDHKSGLPKRHDYGANGGGGYTGKWRGNKATFFEGGVRVPAILRFPKEVTGGHVREQAITAMDWFPTVLDYCGITEAKQHLDGKSLRPIVDSKEAASPHEVLHFQWIKSWAVREGDWKLIGLQGRGEKSTLRLELYNLADDPPESIKHTKDHPEVVARLAKLHESWAKEVQPKGKQ